MTIIKKIAYYTTLKSMKSMLHDFAHNDGILEVSKIVNYLETLGIEYPTCDESIKDLILLAGMKLSEIDGPIVETIEDIILYFEVDRFATIRII